MVTNIRRTLASPSLSYYYFDTMEDMGGGGAGFYLETGDSDE